MMPFESCAERYSTTTDSVMNYHWKNTGQKKFPLLIL